MLFNSQEFVFMFLPVILAGYFLIGRFSQRGALGWLAIASLAFYGYWKLTALPILILSIGCNYGFGRLIARPTFEYRKSVLTLAILANLACLAYFKYVNFFIDNINDVLDWAGADTIHSIKVILPIGISFFTFTQIAFLVDSYLEEIQESDFIQYVLFVSFFPHLLAGPLIHHKQMMPQFALRENVHFQPDRFATGMIIFLIGLAKKVLIADTLNSFVSGFHDSLLQGANPSLWTSWLAAVGYLFQLYFDFSGYSDMAVGAALLFGVWMPFNFNSPLRARNIIDFWQRWHITLTKYIGDYLYIPITLALTRRGQGKAPAVAVLYSLVAPMMLIFLILGIWHGASWTFVVFGLMHGAFITVNHLWRRVFPPLSRKAAAQQQFKLLKAGVAWMLTFLSVLVASVMFRADSVGSAVAVYKGMLGLNGHGLGTYYSDWFRWLAGLKIIFATVAASFAITFLSPNTMAVSTQLATHFARYRTHAFVSMTMGTGLIYALLQVNFYDSPFLYFQF